jgi:hypothetical protein
MFSPSLIFRQSRPANRHTVGAQRQDAVKSMFARGNIDYRAWLRVEELLLQTLLERSIVGRQAPRLRLTALLSTGGGDETCKRDGNMPHDFSRFLDFDVRQVCHRGAAPIIFEL